MAVEDGLVVPAVQWGAGHGTVDRRPDDCKSGYHNFDHIKLTCDGEVKTSFAMIVMKPVVSGGNLV